MNDYISDWSAKILYAAMPWIGIVGVLPWIEIIGQTLIAFLAVLIVHRIGTNILERLTAPFPFSRRIVRYTNRVGRAVVFLLLLQVILRNAPDSLPGISILRHLSALALIASLTWFGVRCVAAIADTIIELNPAHLPDNLQARRVQTQTRVLARSLM